MIAQLLIANGYRCPGRLALPSSVRMSSTADASNGAGSHSSSALGRSLPPAGASHTSCPPYVIRVHTEIKRPGSDKPDS